MTCVYREISRNNAQSVLGDAFDYAVNICHIPGSDFIKLFTASSVSKRMENGEPDYLSGKSGIDIVLEVVSETTGKELEVRHMEHMERSQEYWIGWASAYYQMHSGRKYSDIFKAIPYKDMQAMYYTLHEADVTKFAEIAEDRVKECFPETNLKRFRSLYDCSQSDLAKRSGVSLRSIQMYEQRNKDINKASAETVHSLAVALGCTVEDLLEKQLMEYKENTDM